MYIILNNTLNTIKTNLVVFLEVNWENTYKLEYT